MINTRFDWRHLFLTLGPSLVVMLADTEAGSVITAAQSGAQWGYRLLLLQLLIIPVLYLVQELAARLALSTGKGYGELIRRRFGRGIAYFSVVTLLVSCLSTLIMELGGLAGVGQLFGVVPWQSMLALIVLILLMVGFGAYQSVERAVIVLGLFELAFLLLAWRAHPSWQQIGSQMRDIPLGNRDYLYLLAANLGTSVMPWAIFYQQSAMIDKGLGPAQLKYARVEILIGAVFCQMVTAGILIAAAAAFTGHSNPVMLGTVEQIMLAFGQTLGMNFGHIVFAVGLSGGALVATIVICLTVAWVIGEVSGRHHSLEAHPLEAPWFYSAFTLFLLLAGGIVASGLNLLRLSIAMAVVNALLIPIALGFLFMLARSELRGELQLKGRYAALVAVIFATTAITSVYASIAGAWS